MSWTQPKTWNVGELVTADDLNTHLRDNLLALKSPPTASNLVDAASDFSTTSTAFVDVDGTGSDFELTLTTTGGDLLVGFFALVSSTGASGAGIRMDFTVDGVAFAGDDGVSGVRHESVPVPISFVALVTGLAAGSHTLKLVWKTTAGTATLYGGAGTTNDDVHPQFWAREVS